MIATFIFARECNLLSLGPQGIALFVLIYHLILFLAGTYGRNRRIVS